MDVRPYLPADREGCLEIFDSIAPQFPASDGRAQFATFLDRAGATQPLLDSRGSESSLLSRARKQAVPSQQCCSPTVPYFVMEHEGGVTGCGGYRIEAGPGLASLVWGMVRRDCQRQGLGRYLLMYRLREIGKAGAIDRVRLETPQESAAFFAGQGFKVVSAAHGRVEMVKKLAVCA